MHSADSGLPGLPRLSHIIQAKTRPARSAFRGLHSFECELFWMPTFIYWKKRHKIFEMNARRALAAASVRVLGCYLGLKYIQGEPRVAAVEQEE